MKRAVTLLVILFASGCATYQRVGEADALKMAAWRAIGHEQVAWIARDAAALPRGMESVVALKNMKAHVEHVDLSGSNGTVTTTYWYNGTFSTPEGERNGTLTIQRRLHFTRDDRGTWSESAPAEEIARSSRWSSERRVS